MNLSLLLDYKDHTERIETHATKDSQRKEREGSLCDDTKLEHDKTCSCICHVVM